ncbi:unnamed protein product [Toxocara canis]|uniref:Rab-GAP TBC domain-containing protein n=1 Tax=Toxocara canis TaxID=6265 RepID=A0A183UEB8_TOXCA|nr:unnamed protein product [Toxocara canis]
MGGPETPMSVMNKLHELFPDREGFELHQFKEKCCEEKRKNFEEATIGKMLTCLHFYACYVDVWPDLCEGGLAFFVLTEKAVWLYLLSMEPRV